tara:strand:+ start:1603 stop:2037 length:435 start_codon:yes stop_codon:yes gene_type:complete
MGNVSGKPTEIRCKSGKTFFSLKSFYCYANITKGNLLGIMKSKKLNLNEAADYVLSKIDLEFKVEIKNDKLIECNNGMNFNTITEFCSYAGINYNYFDRIRSKMNLTTLEAVDYILECGCDKDIIASNQHVTLAKPDILSEAWI